jgi:hypothetical protein
MSAAVLRRAGFVATIAVAMLMVAAAVDGMRRVDTTLRRAAASPAVEGRVLVLDRSARPWHGHRGPGRDCDRRRARGPRV